MHIKLQIMNKVRSYHVSIACASGVAVIFEDVLDHLTHSLSWPELNNIKTYSPYNCQCM